MTGGEQRGERTVAEPSVAEIMKQEETERQRETRKELGEALRAAALQAAVQLPNIEKYQEAAFGERGVQLNKEKKADVQSRVVAEIAKDLKEFENAPGFSGEKFSHFLKKQVAVGAKGKELEDAIKDEMLARLGIFDESEASEREVNALVASTEKAFVPEEKAEEDITEELDAAFDAIQANVEQSAGAKDESYKIVVPSKVAMSQVPKGAKGREELTQRSGSFSAVPAQQ